MEIRTIHSGNRKNNPNTSFQGGSNVRKAVQKARFAFHPSDVHVKYKKGNRLLGMVPLSHLDMANQITNRATLRIGRRNLVGGLANLAEQGDSLTKMIYYRNKFLRDVSTQIDDQELIKLKRLGSQVIQKTHAARMKHKRAMPGITKLPKHQPRINLSTLPRNYQKLINEKHMQTELLLNRGAIENRRWTHQPERIYQK